MMWSRGESTVELRMQDAEEKIYVAVGKDVEESRLNLLWVLHNFTRKKIFILYVHQAPSIGQNHLVNRVGNHEVRIYEELEKQIIHKILDGYLRICRNEGVLAEKVHIEMEHTGEGIVKLINQHCIKKLVMGAAADRNYIEEMTGLKSATAKYVQSYANPSCRIWFTCKGHLICTRYPSQYPFVGKIMRKLEIYTIRGASKVIVTANAINVHREHRVDVEGISSSLQTSSITENGPSNPRRSPRGSSQFSCSSRGAIDDLVSTPYEGTEGNEYQSELSALSLYQSELSALSLRGDQHLTPPSVMEENNKELYDQLVKSMVEVERLKREASEQSSKSGKAEQTAIEAMCRVKALETLYTEELRRRKEVEEALAKEKEGSSQKMKKQEDEELLNALDQKLLLESQVASFDHMMKELNEKLSSAVELMKFFKEERDDLEIERDNAIKVNEELRKEQAFTKISEFSYSEIQEATRDFDPSLKIGEGGYGSIYKGFLRHTQVAIKVLSPDSMQGQSEFKQEIEVLSKLRHPNLVTLIGICPEACALIYDYVPNGSLEDRLSCKDNTPPLPWQTRIRIAAELCSVLIFLHSSKPHSIVHGDLKPGNILLDTNFVSKLSDFGICRALSLLENIDSNMTLCHRTEPKGSFMYLDPQFLTSGELSPKSDIYSFGIILLQLLTGRAPLGIAKDVQDAISEENLNAVLDPTAGDWPFVQAQQLALIALRCCELNRSSRPDLGSEVWRILDPMRASCEASSAFRLGSDAAPSYFMCPILQEVMQDPHVAADGFTYEAEALQGWLEHGHDTSPMTNLTLANNNLVPNHTLRSAIQEWLQNH